MDRRDEQAHLYDRISKVLTVGIVASIAIMIFGFLLLLRNGENAVAHLPSFSQLVEGVLRLDASSIIWLAALVLILTPISRVVTATLLFIHERDTRYFFITLTVLILIILSFLVGLILSGFRLG